MKGLISTMPKFKSSGLKVFFNDLSFICIVYIVLKFLISLFFNEHFNIVPPTRMEWFMCAYCALFFLTYHCSKSEQ